MLKIHSTRVPDESALRAALARYLAALAAHAVSVGEPAPWPEFEVLREIAAHPSRDFVVGFDPEPPAPVPPTAADLARGELMRLDAASVRSMREWIAAQPTAPQVLKDREAAAVLERAKLV